MLDKIKSFFQSEKFKSAIAVIKGWVAESKFWIGFAIGFGIAWLF